MSHIKGNVPTESYTVRTMHYFSEFIACLVILAVAEGERREIRFFSGEDAVLSCAAKSKPDVQYRSITWCKVSEEPSQLLSGLIRKRLTENNGTVEKYKGVEREFELLESSMSLLLSNVTTEDSGIYKCFLSAPLGQQNQEDEILLKVDEYSTVEKIEFITSDKIYGALAVVLLIIAFPMFCISYECISKHQEAFKRLFGENATSRQEIDRPQSFDLQGNAGSVCVMDGNQSTWISAQQKLNEALCTGHGESTELCSRGPSGDAQEAATYLISLSGCK